MRIALLALVAGFSLALPGRSAAAEASPPPVRLPEYTVTASAPTLPPEHWRYARIPGFEILAQAPDSEIQALAVDLERTIPVMETAWPAFKVAPEVQTTIVICDTEAQFDRFVPGKVSDELKSTTFTADRLFFHDDASSIAVICTPGLANAADFESDILRLYALRRIAMVRPAVPAWFAEGIAQILCHADSPFDRLIDLGMLRDPGAGKDASGILHYSADDSAASAITPDVRDILQSSLDAGSGITSAQENSFIAYFARAMHPVPPLGEVFAGPPAGELTSWKMGCWAFVHYCLFGNRRRQPALAEFLALLRQNPNADPEPFFKQAFGRSYSGMGAGLSGYARWSHFRTDRYTYPDVPPAVVADATDAEAGQIEGDAFRLAGYPDLANQEMVSAYRREAFARRPHDPRLLAALGVCEAGGGDPLRARALLEAAAGADYPSSAALVALARLRLAAAPAGRPLAAQPTAACLAPLLQALRLCPPNVDVYDLIAQVWTRSSASAGPDDLAPINRGIGLFPTDTALAFEAVELNLHNGHADMARTIIGHELGLAMDQADRTRFLNLKDKLARTQNPPVQGGLPQS